MAAAIEADLAKKIQRLIKDSKLKVQAAIQGDTVRVHVTPPDFVPTAAAGWGGSLVPRPAPDGTPASAPAPRSRARTSLREMAAPSAVE